jgi:hypothetical protein
MTGFYILDAGILAYSGWLRKVKERSKKEQPDEIFKTFILTK